MWDKDAEPLGGRSLLQAFTTEVQNHLRVRVLVRPRDYIKGGKILNVMNPLRGRSLLQAVLQGGTLSTKAR